MMICKFLQFVLLNTFNTKLVFKISEGKVIRRRNDFSKRNETSDSIIWSIIDPFIKEINYGKQIKKEQVKLMTEEMM